MIAGLEAGGGARPIGIAGAAQLEARVKALVGGAGGWRRPAVRRRAAARLNPGTQEGVLTGRKTKFEAGAARLQPAWVGFEAHGGLAEDVVAAKIGEYDPALVHDRVEVRSVRLADHAPHLKHVHEIDVKLERNGELDRLEAKVVEAEAIEELAAQKLLTPDVDGILRQVEVVAQHQAGGRELDLGQNVLLAAGRQHHGAVFVDAQLPVAEKARVLVEEANVGATGRHNVARQCSGEEGLAVNQGEVVDPAWLSGARHARLRRGG